jgi:hypothetical protein
MNEMLTYLRLLMVFALLDSHLADRTDACRCFQFANMFPVAHALEQKE